MGEYKFIDCDVCTIPTEVVIYKNGRDHAIIEYAVYNDKFLHGINLVTENGVADFLPNLRGKGFDNLDECLTAAKQELSEKCRKNIKSGFDVETHKAILNKLQQDNQLTLF